MVSKFAYATKKGTVDSEEGCLQLPWDLDQLGSWVLCYSNVEL